MRPRGFSIGLAVVGLVLGAVRAGARGGGVFTIALRFAPQEAVADASVLLAPTLSDRPLLLKLADGRAGSDRREQR